jgi:MoaD family protein
MENQVKLKFFAAFREVTGQRELNWAWQQGQTANSVLAELLAKYPSLEGIARVSLVMVNRAYQDRDLALQPGDEVVFVPPVGGGK